MIKFLFSLVCLFCFFVSCQEENSNIDLLKTADGGVIKVKKEEVISLDPKKLNFRNSRPSGEGPVIDTSYGGATTLEKEDWIRIKFTNKVEGFEANKIYYAKYAVCVQNIDIRGYNELTPIYSRKKHMGFHPSIPIENMELGARIDNWGGKTARCTTKLLYIGYDEQLREVDTYYPILPNKIIWYTIKSVYDWKL